MVYHILNGDSLAFSFPDAKIDGEIIVVREGLIDGDLSGDDLHRFWKSRTDYLGITEAQYQNAVANEFEKILKAPDGSEFNLWFEYDLFCQVNMWFVLSIINCLSVKKKVYAVYTTHLGGSDKHFWNGFGPADANELINCFANRTSLTDVELRLGEDLWVAYKSNHLEELLRLANSQSSAFPHLKEVIKAHVDRFPKDGTKGRPEKVLEEIIEAGSTDFHTVFQEFWNRESIYGFGDTQLKKLYGNIMRSQ